MTFKSTWQTGKCALQTTRIEASWKTLALCALGLLMVGIGAFLADYAAKGGIDFIDEHSGLFLLAILIGMLISLVSIVGWAKCLDRHERGKMGAILCLAPVGVCIVGSLIGGTNVHGPFILIFLPMFPISVLGLALLILVAVSARE